MSVDTSGWTVRCAACGLVRPWEVREAHRGQCPVGPVALEDALEALGTAAERFA